MRTECDNHALTKAPRSRAMLGGSSECWVRACLYSFLLKRKVQWKPQATFLSLPRAHERGDHLLPREGLFFRKLLLARCWKKSRRLGHGAPWLRRGFHRPGYKVREFIHSAPLTSFFFSLFCFVFWLMWSRLSIFSIMMSFSLSHPHAVRALVGPSGSAASLFPIRFDPNEELDSETAESDSRTDGQTQAGQSSGSCFLKKPGQKVNVN